MRKRWRFILEWLPLFIWNLFLIIALKYCYFDGMLEESIVFFISFLYHIRYYLIIMLLFI